MMKRHPVLTLALAGSLAGTAFGELIHDADHYVLKAQHAEQWAADDKAVPLRNSTEFAAACAEKGVDVVCHVYAHGGHGFGLKGRGDSDGWPKRLEEWLVSMKLAHAAAAP